MTQFSAPTYDIARPTGQCAHSGRVLQPGEAYIAALVELDSTASPPSAGSSAANVLGFKRLDFSLEAWDQGHRPPQLFGHWKTTVPLPNHKRKVFVDDDVLMNLLRRLADTDQPQRLAFRFVLALILMRKKLLRYDGTVKKPATEPGAGDCQWWRMTPKLDISKGPFGKWNDEEVIEVLDPHLDEEQIRQVTDQLNEILNAEL
jgi:hypothetical protein